MSLKRQLKFDFFSQLKQFKKRGKVIMQNHKFIINEYLTTILNNRVFQKQNGSSNFNTLNYLYNQKSNDYSLWVSIYLEHVTDHRKILTEQWILQCSNSNEINVTCGKFCSFEKKSLCCLLQQSPLKQNFLNKQHCFKNYQLQIVIDHWGKNQNLELYKCYHLNINESLKIIARFHQHLNLSEEVGKQRSLSFQLQEIIPKQNNRLTRFNSEQLQTPEKKVFMYSVDEDVTFLIDENQAERLMSQNSDSDFMIQTIDEETDTTDWQVIDHKNFLTKDQKKVLDSLKEMRNSFNSKSKHSHQIAKALELIK